MGIVPASAFHSSELMRSLAADCAAHQLDLKAGLYQMMLCCLCCLGAYHSETASGLQSSSISVTDSALHADREILGGRILQECVKTK